MFKVSFLRRLATLMLVLAGVALLTGWGWGRSAQLIQLVRPTSGAEASLFGTAEGETSVPGTPIGSPQTLIIRTTGAFLPGNGPSGLRYVSEPALRAAGEYPLQLKTVTLLRNAVAFTLLGLSLALWVVATGLQRSATSHRAMVL